MTDTGHFPERGQLDPTGGRAAPAEPHHSAAPGYPYPEADGAAAEDTDDEDLLMPGSHGAWREPHAPTGPPAPEAPAAGYPGGPGGEESTAYPAAPQGAPGGVPAAAPHPGHAPAALPITDPQQSVRAEPGSRPAGPVLPEGAAEPGPQPSEYGMAAPPHPGPGVLPTRPGGWQAAPADPSSLAGPVAGTVPPAAAAGAPSAPAPAPETAGTEPALPSAGNIPGPDMYGLQQTTGQDAPGETVTAPPAPVPGTEPPSTPSAGQGTPPLDQEAATGGGTEAGDGSALATVPAPREESEGPSPGMPGVATAATETEREAVHRLMRERQDTPQGFRPDPVPQDALLRVLEAAHTAPAVGHAQPWDFVIIRSPDTRRAVHDLAVRQRSTHTASLSRAQARQLQGPPAEAVLDAPVSIVVTADATRGGHAAHLPESRPEHAPHSSALAVENLWLAARAENLAVGWIGFLDERELITALGLPEHLDIVAYLCLGYPSDNSDSDTTGAATRRPLSWVVHEESYGRRALPGAEAHDLLGETLGRIRPLDAQALGAAWEYQRRMTKPTGALGALEVISAQLCGLTRSCPPPLPEPAALAIFAGDHGVHAQRVTTWPQEVTAQMVANVLGGGAVCNAFAAQVGVEVCVIDVGVRGELPATSGLMPRRIRSGTADFTAGPALTRDEVVRALEVGIETARDLVAAGHRVLLTGEMGVANTTVSAALTAAFTGAEPAEVTGRGSGIDDETYARKVAVVRAALDLHRPDPADPLAVLETIGGLEHAALTGFVLGGASLRVPVVLDGLTGGAAALAARAIAPESVSACIAGHRSAEPGHVAGLTALGLRPLVDLDLRLGEGTGALLALPVVQAAARSLREVATFDSAGITDKN